jgi:hypothetical protein
MSITLYQSEEKEIKTQQLVYLISGYIAGILNNSEIARLERWLLQSIHNQLLFAELLLPYNIRQAMGLQ